MRGGKTPPSAQDHPDFLRIPTICAHLASNLPRTSVPGATCQGPKSGRRLNVGPVAVYATPEYGNLAWADSVAAHSAGNFTQLLFA